MARAQQACREVMKVRKVLAVKKKLPRKLLLKLSLKVTTGFSDKSLSLGL